MHLGQNILSLFQFKTLSTTFKQLTFSLNLLTMSPHQAGSSSKLVNFLKHYDHLFEKPRIWAFALCKN